MSLRGWDRACEGHCGQIVGRDVYCWSEELQERVPLSFCQGKPNKPSEQLECWAGIDPNTGEEKKCFDWFVIVNPDDMTCHPVDPNNPQCGPNAGYQNMTWHCVEEGKCLGPKPEDTTKSCEIPCTNWVKTLGPCQNQNGQKNVQCEIGAAMQTVTWTCPPGSLCDENKKPSDGVQSCLIGVPCRQWIGEPAAACLGNDSKAIVGCGEGTQAIAYTCAGGDENMCNPWERETLPKTQPCSVTQACTWRSDPWQPQIAQRR